MPCIFFFMYPLIDIHTHRMEFEPGTVSVFNLLMEEQLQPGPSLSGARLFSAGLHPWRLNPGIMDFRLKELAALAAQNRCIAIGESGLDKSCKTPFELQLQAFESHVSLSEEFHKPLIIHCVRADAELLSVKKNLRPAQKWVIHSFQGSEEKAREFLRHGFLLSMGAALLKTNSKIRKTLPSIPLGRIFFETDESRESLREIYEEAASLLRIKIDELAKTVYGNFVKTFGEQNVPD